MAIENFQRARHPVSNIGHTMAGPGEIFKIEILRRLENAILKLESAIFEVGFCKCSILQESNVTHLLHRICRMCIRYSFVSGVYYRPTMVGLGENFSKLRFSEGSKALFSDWLLQIQ